MLSQLVTVPCLLGYFRVGTSFLPWVSPPTYTDVLLAHAHHDTLVSGDPTMAGDMALEALPPARPASHMSESLSVMSMAASSSIRNDTQCRPVAERAQVFSAEHSEDSLSPRGKNDIWPFSQGRQSRNSLGRICIDTQPRRVQACLWTGTRVFAQTCVLAVLFSSQ